MKFLLLVGNTILNQAGRFKKVDEVCWVLIQREVQVAKSGAWIGLVPCKDAAPFQRCYSVGGPISSCARYALLINL